MKGESIAVNRRFHQLMALVREGRDTYSDRVELESIFKKLNDENDRLEEANRVLADRLAASNQRFCACTHAPVPFADQMREAMRVETNKEVPPPTGDATVDEARAGAFFSSRGRYEQEGQV